ncbi:MAG: sensor histidine kinase [Chitinophagaceae bacterium]
MGKDLFLLLVSISVSFHGIAQELTNDGLGVIRTDKKPVILFNGLHVAKEDTNKVKLLISLCGYHWYDKRNKDSVARYAEEARKLSLKLHFTPGFNEACFILCKNYLYNDQPRKARDFLPTLSRDQQARFLLAIGERYLFLPELEKKDLDSAFLCFSGALRIARLTGNRKWKHESLIAIGKYHYSSGEVEKGKQSFLEIIKDLQQTKEVSKEAHIWSEMGKYMPDTDSTLHDQLWANNTARRMYEALKDTGNLYSTIEDIAFILMYHSDYDTAKRMFQQVISLRKLVGSKKIDVDARPLAWIAYSIGNLEEALEWSLIMEKYLEARGEVLTGIDSLFLGMIYAADGQAERALTTLLAIDGKLYDDFPYVLARTVTAQYIMLGQASKALTFLQTYVKKYPPTNPENHASLAAARGDVYMALSNPVLAGRYYREMIGWDKRALQFKARNLRMLPWNVAGAESYIKMARFHVWQHRYREAAPFLDMASNINAAVAYRFVSANMRRDIHGLKYKVDSAAGNYQAALEHHIQYGLLNDSITNAVKIRRFHQLEIQYETARKNLTIQQRDDQIRDMKVIERLQRTNLQKSTVIRNISIVATIVFLLLAVMFYRQYRQKRQANRLVTIQNDRLQHVVNEKEWLLKEVHHRVKNNLHTIICLLESQANYLKGDALQAIESSQHRIYAMSLIHQKLYQVEDVKTIDMRQYLSEFTVYLQQSFGNNNNILYKLNVEDIHLDVAVAIPIALIVNEAVTNAIKYAFPDRRKGTIDISMRRTGDEIVLVIADDGVGITKHLTGKMHNSLGMDLMKGLTREIRGRIELLSDAGTTIVIRLTTNTLIYTSTRSEEGAYWQHEPSRL